MLVLTLNPDNLMNPVHVIREMIAAECPTLSHDCVDGTAGGARYFNTAVNYVKTRFPQAELAFTYGSVARGTPTAFSDIDLYVIVPGEPGLRVLEVFEGLPLEARVLSREVVERILAIPVEVSTLAGYLVGALAGAKLVTGSPDLLAHLRACSERWLAVCPTDLSLENIAMHRTRTTNRVLDLASERLCSFRRIKAIFEIVDSIRVLSLADRGVFQGKNLLEHLVEHWPERGAELRAAIDAVLERNDSVPLVTLAFKALEPFGGPLMDRYMCRVNIPSAPKLPMHRAA